MIILEEQAGLNAGLNKGLKIGKMLKKNVRLRNVSIKNAIKVGKVAVPLATTAMSFIPGGGVASKILDSKVGKLLTKVKNGKVVKFATKIANSKVGKFAMDNVVKPTIKNAISGGGSVTLQQQAGACGQGLAFQMAGRGGEVQRQAGCAGQALAFIQ